MDIFDSHLHIGALTEQSIIYPSEIKTYISRYGVRGGLIMPTAHIGGSDNLELHDQLYHEALNSNFQIALYLNLDILKELKENRFKVKYPFSAFKIHPEAVDFSDNDLDDVCAVVKDIKKPIMIHTGGIKCAHASRFEYLIKKYKHQIFILCHGRPSDEAFGLLYKYENVWIDTAFLSIERLINNIAEYNEDRILFGSDFPINQWFSELSDDENWYQKQIVNIYSAFSIRVTEKVLRDNYLKLFCNN